MLINVLRHKTKCILNTLKSNRLLNATTALCKMITGRSACTARCPVCIRQWNVLAESDAQCPSLFLLFAGYFVCFALWFPVSDQGQNLKHKKRAKCDWRDISHLHSKWKTRVNIYFRPRWQFQFDWTGWISLFRRKEPLIYSTTSTAKPSFSWQKMQEVHTYFLVMHIS